MTMIRGTGTAFDASGDKIATVHEEQGYGQTFREHVIPAIAHFVLGLVNGHLESELAGRPFSRIEIKIEVERP